MAATVSSAYTSSKSGTVDQVGGASTVCIDMPGIILSPCCFHYSLGTVYIVHNVHVHVNVYTCTCIYVQNYP